MRRKKMRRKKIRRKRVRISRASERVNTKLLRSNME
jgi:hypothetical protein